MYYRQAPLADDFVLGRSWDYIKFARLHNSFASTGTRIDYFFRAKARTEPHMGDIFRFFYLPSSVDLLLTVRTRFLYECSPPSVSLTAERPFPLQGTHVIPILFWSQSHKRAPALLNCSPSGNPYDPDFSVHAFASEQQPVRLLKPNFWNAITLRLYERACWPDLPGLRMSSFRALALVKRAFFLCVFFFLIFCCLFVVSPYKNITHHMT